MFGVPKCSFWAVPLLTAGWPEFLGRWVNPARVETYNTRLVFDEVRTLLLAFLFDLGSFTVKCSSAHRRGRAGNLTTLGSAVVGKSVQGLDSRMDARKRKSDNILAHCLIQPETIFVSTNKCMWSCGSLLPLLTKIVANVLIVPPQVHRWTNPPSDQGT